MKRGRDGEWGAACLELAELAARRDILTGTPAPNAASDLLIQFDFLWPHQRARLLKQPPGARKQPSLSSIAERIGPLFVRVDKRQLGLKSPRLRVEQVEMGELQRSIYQHMRRRARSVIGPERRLATMGNVVAYLNIAATNPGLLAEPLDGSAPAQTQWPVLPSGLGQTLTELIAVYARHEIPSKYVKLSQVVAANAAQGRKTLVWTNYISSINVIANEILAPYFPAIVHGGLPRRSDTDGRLSRERELGRFRNDSECKVLIANPAALAEGVSLHHACSDAIFLDRTFNAGHHLQAIDRIHRLGMDPSERPRVTFLVARETIDEVIDLRIRAKTRVLQTLLKDSTLSQMALPDDELEGEEFDDADIEALFAHLGGARDV